jgi:hypothetical protein
VCNCLTCGSGEDRNYLIRVGGREWFFEWHHYCGPMVIHRRTWAEVTQPGERSPFWQAVQNWHEQGRRIDDAGFCVWEPTPEPQYVHLGGRNYAIVPDGMTPEQVLADFGAGPPSLTLSLPCP